MEGFQAKENTFIERTTKESPFGIRQEIREADSRRLGQVFYLQMVVLNMSQECDVPPAFQVKQSAKVMVWGDMTGGGLTSYTCYPQAKP